MKCLKISLQSCMSLKTAFYCNRERFARKQFMVDTRQRGTNAQIEKHCESPITESTFSGFSANTCINTLPHNAAFRCTNDI